jgi:acyl-CoA synthetase (AMP-forming)/AMP-acid ligase II
MFWGVLDHPNRGDYNLSTLRTALVSAASIPVELVERMKAELRLDVVMTGYGLTENHALGSFTRPTDSPSVVATTVGKMAPDLRARIVDDQGRELPNGQPGEVLIAGYAHMSGYYEDPEATESTIRDGWLYTGDVGVIDDEGYLRITDRKKDMYVMGGFNVAPAEVERALMRHGGVAEVAVIGIPDERFGEVGAAYVVPKTGATLNPDEVIAYARQNLANYKVPRHVEILAELPHNATGKVLKGWLREAAHRRSLDTQG